MFWNLCCTLNFHHYVAVLSAVFIQLPLFIFSVLRKMLAFGFNIKTPDKSEEAISFVKMVFERLHTLVQASKYSIILRYTALIWSA